MTDEDKIAIEDIVTDAIQDAVQEVKDVKDHAQDFIGGGVILFVVLNLVWGLFAYNAIDRTARRSDPPEIQVQYRLEVCTRVVTEKGKAISQECTYSVN